jgi:hypothetical protein
LSIGFFKTTGLLSETTIWFMLTTTKEVKGVPLKKKERKKKNLQKGVEFVMAQIDSTS